MSGFTNYLFASLVLAGSFAAPAFAEDASVVAGEAFFHQRCQTCHNPEADKKTFGPSLIGVVGRKAGTIEGFPYSDVLKTSGIVWTEAMLHAWMEDNDKMLPGTRMRHIGVTDVAEQEMIIAYLKALK